jgi:hypothetical protein
MNVIRSLVLLVIMAPGVVVACSGAEWQRPPQTPTGDSGHSPESVARDTAAPEFFSGWSADFDGVGPLKIGMTRQDAEGSIGNELQWPDDPEPGCDYGGVRSSATDLFFLISDGRIGRIDIYHAGIPSQGGIRIGDLEDRVHAVHGDRLQVERHPYTDGHYLLVSSPTDPARWMIFETSDGVVISFRTGRRPVVDWVEGCS